MTRTIERSYVLSEREVHEAIVAYLTAKGVPAPTYVGDTPTCKWKTRGDNSISIRWTEQDELE